MSRDRPLRLRLEVPNEDGMEDINQQLLMRGLAIPVKQRQPTRAKPIQPKMEEAQDGMMQQEGPSLFSLFI